MGDDIVFFIFLYQRYIYKEDPTRVNEFGYSGDMLTQKEGEGEVKDDTETSPAIEDASVEEAEEVVEAVSEELVGDSSNQSSSAWKDSKQKSKKAKKID